MTFTDWAGESAERVREDGLAGVTESGYELYVGALRRLGDVYDPGEPVYGREWDVLLVLDACRYDLMLEVADEYDFVEEVERFTSTASSSRQWMSKNFVPGYAEEMAGTAHVTGNPFSQRCLDPDDWARLDEVWRYAWDEDLGTIRPRPLTDRAVAAWRDLEPERMIVHYMQPHYPFIPRPELHDGMGVAGFGDADEPFWALVRRGEVDRETAWDAYRENLRVALDEVAFLRRVIDAEKVVVTADHGNAVGRFGLYGHPDRVPLSVLRTVPWVETDAEATEAYEPETVPGESIGTETTSKLEDLGYM